MHSESPLPGTAPPSADQLRLCDFSMSACVCAMAIDLTISTVLLFQLWWVQRRLGSGLNEGTVMKKVIERLMVCFRSATSQLW